MKITENKIIFDSTDWLDGLNTQYGSAGLVMGNTIANASAFNPYRPLGIASPGLGSSLVTNNTTVTGMVISGVPKSGTFSKGILLGNDGKIHELTFSSSTITNAGAYPHTIADGHATFVGEDLITYTAKVSGTLTKLHFYSYRDGTDWNIGRLIPSSDTFDDDFMSTVPASPLASPYLADGKSAPHPMIVGADDIVYIGDRNYVHAYDGSNGNDGTFTAATWTIPAGFYVTSFAKYESGIVVFAYKQDQTDSAGTTSANSSAFFFAYSTSDPTKVVELDDNYVNAGFSWKGTVGCFTSGRLADDWQSSTANKSSDLRIYDGTDFVSVCSFDGTVPIYRGIDIRSDEILWNSDGNIFSYGTRLNATQNKLNKVGITTVGSSSGFLRSLTTTQQYFSTGNGASGGLMYFSNDYSAATFKSIYAQPNFQQGFMGILTSVEVFLYTKGTSSNGALTMNVNYFGSGSGQQTIFSSKDLFTKYTNIYRYDTSNALFQEFTMIGIELAWSACTATPPKVQKIILNYEPRAYK